MKSALKNTPSDLFIIFSLAPKYEELASLYADVPALASKVTVAKIDATTNDVPDSIQGFPTIKLFPAGSKDSPVEYSGPRSVEDLANFVKEQGTHKVDAFAAGDEKAEEEADATLTVSISSKATSESAAPTESEKADHDEL